jgi:hypothetical protein
MKFNNISCLFYIFLFKKVFGYRYYINMVFSGQLQSELILLQTESRVEVFSGDNPFSHVSSH